MNHFFLKLLNMSISASWVALAVVILRLALKKAPRSFTCFLWALVGLRLICPFSLESALSLVPTAETITPSPIPGGAPIIDSGVPLLDQAAGVFLPSAGSVSAPAPAPAPDTLSVTDVLGWVWLAGLALMGLYGMISFLRVRRKTRISMPAGKRIRICDDIDTPFILGIFRPTIFLPSGLDNTQTECILAHELAHLRRRDHWWKPIGFMLLAIHWFNPMMWAAYILLCRDIEQACDEQVLRSMTAERVQTYTRTLLNCSISRRTIAVCPLAFGETDVRSRIKHALHYKKPAFGLVLVSLLLCIAAAVCLLTDPLKPKKQDDTPPDDTNFWTVNVGLDHAISTAILDYYASPYTVREHTFEAHYPIGVAEDGGRVTAYLIAMYKEYRRDDNRMISEVETLAPVAITMAPSKGDYGPYTPVDYQSIRNIDTTMESALQRLFPAELQEQADPAQYADALRASCDQQAADYVKTLTAAAPPENTDAPLIYYHGDRYAPYTTVLTMYESSHTFAACFSPSLADRTGLMITGTYQRLDSTILFTSDNGFAPFTLGYTADALIYNSDKYGPLPAGDI